MVGDTELDVSTAVVGARTGVFLDLAYDIKVPERGEGIGLQDVNLQSVSCQDKVLHNDAIGDPVQIRGVGEFEAGYSFEE